MFWRVAKTLLLILALFVSGCATQHAAMTRDEYLKTTQRTYQNIAPDEVFKAAEKLFVLADGDDFSFHYTDDSMSASRNWSVYLVLAAAMGTDTWLVKTQSIANATKVSAMVTTSSGSVAPMATTGGDWTATGLPGGGRIVPGTAIYDVFWARMDYLLGKSDRWMTCEESNARVAQNIVWGTNEALCNSFNVKDDVPQKLKSEAR